MTKQINIAARRKAAKPHTGFSSPRVWLQILYVTEDEKAYGFNGSEDAVHSLACALIQLRIIDVVLKIKGSANLDAPERSDILAEYRRDKTTRGGEQIVVPASHI